MHNQRFQRTVSSRCALGPPLKRGVGAGYGKAIGALGWV